MELYAAFGSQFHQPNDEKMAKTHISRPEFLEFVRSRSRFYGEKAGFLYGEPFYIDNYVGLDNFRELL